MEKVIEKAQKVAILYDTDSDGICSGTIAKHVMEDLGKEVVLTSPAAPNIPDFVMQMVEESEADLVITVDLSVDVSKDKIAASEKQWLIIDHHQITYDLNQLKNAIHKNPVFKDKTIYCPASKYIYDIFLEAFGKTVETYDWLACIGLIGDAAFPIYKDFVKDVLKKYGYGFSNDPYETKFGELDRMVSSGRLYKGVSGTIKVYEIISKCRTIKEFEDKAEILKEWDAIVSAEIKNVLNDFKENKEMIGDIFLYNLHSKLNIGSPICGMIAGRYKHKTIVVYYNSGSLVKLHFRRSDGAIDLSKVARELTAKYENAGGGGHPKASGAHLRADDWPVFKEELIERLKSESPRS